MPTTSSAKPAAQPEPSADPAGSSPSYWRYVRLREFESPKYSPQVAVRKGLFRLFDGFRERKEPKEVDDFHARLERLSDSRTDQVAPPPDWRESVPALDRVLNDWVENRRDASRLELIVGSPYGGTAEALTHWARLQGMPIIEPPSAAEILRGGEAWLRRSLAHGDDATALVIPRLERCYLRHTLGLDLTRHLLRRILGERQRCVIGCSSWAWAYLSTVLGLDKMAPQPWTLDALDQNDLQQWLGTLASRGGGPATLFRQVDSGALVIPSASELTDRFALSKSTREQPGKTEPESSPFLAELAAYARGNPGLAWHLWRHSLRVTPRLGENPSPASDAAGLTIWVEPWESVKPPELPTPCEPALLLVLHALLLHDGVSEGQLTGLLPLSGLEVLQTLTVLGRSGLAEPGQAGWRVTGLGYPVVRKRLSREGYLVDAL